MHPSDPQYAAYLGALKRYGRQPLVVETTVHDLLVLGSALHLALAHPQMTPALRQAVAVFLETMAGALASRDPVLGAIARLGASPACTWEG